MARPDLGGVHALVHALATSTDARLQRLLVELLYRATTPAPAAIAASAPAAAASLRAAAIACLRQTAAAAAEAFGALRPAHFEADCRAVLAGLHPSGSPATVQTAAATAAWYCGAALGRPAGDGLFWLDFSQHALTFEACLPGEAEHDLVEIPYTTLLDAELVAAPDAHAAATSSTTRCLRMLLTIAPSVLRDLAGHGVLDVAKCVVPAAR